MLNRYTLLSLILHLALFSPLFIKSEVNPETKGGEPMANILPKSLESFEVFLDGVEPTKTKKVKKKKAEHGYWGLGMYTNNDMSFTLNGIQYFGSLIVTLPPDYPAYNAGLLVNDIIFAIDNLPITDQNDIKGDGPKTMTLSIYRNGQVIYITTQREWIATDFP